MDNENKTPQENQQDQTQNQQQYQQPQYQQTQYQQQYQQPQYQQPQYQYQHTARNPKDGLGLSITSLVVGCCSILFCWTPVLNIILLACGIIAIIMGAAGRKKSILAYGRASGIATAGLVLGIIGTVITGIGAVSCLACVGCASCAACESIGAASAFGSML